MNQYKAITKSSVDNVQTFFTDTTEMQLVSLGKFSELEFSFDKENKLFSFSGINEITKEELVDLIDFLMVVRNEL
jgi:hypothetical protein